MSTKGQYFIGEASRRGMFNWHRAGTEGGPNINDDFSPTGREEEGGTEGGADRNDDFVRPGRGGLSSSDHDSFVFSHLGFTDRCPYFYMCIYQLIYI